MGEKEEGDKKKREKRERRESERDCALDTLVGTRTCSCLRVLTLHVFARMGTYLCILAHTCVFAGPRTGASESWLGTAGSNWNLEVQGVGRTVGAWGWAMLCWQEL